MKKSYTTPVVEKIEFDYLETVTASNGDGGGCGMGGGQSSSIGHIHPTYGQSVYRDSNSGYNCDSSLTPDQGCGNNGVHTSNVGYVCGN